MFLSYQIFIAILTNVPIIYNVGSVKAMFDKYFLKNLNIIDFINSLWNVNFSQNILSVTNNNSIRHSLGSIRSLFKDSVSFQVE